MFENNEPKSTVNNQKNHRQDNQRFRDVVCEPDTRFAESHNIQSAVAKSGNSVKKSDLQRSFESIMRQKTERQQNRTDCLNNQTVTDDPLFCSNDPAYIVDSKTLCHCHPLPHADTAVGEQKEKDYCRHKSQSADFDHHEYNSLAERTPLRPDVAERKARDTGGGCCGE